jgi:hypothetical protein
MFDMVQNLLKQDTRAAKKGSSVYPLSGIILCGGCGGAMVRKTNTKGGRQYPYYVCSNHRADKTVCSTHIISFTECENAVLSALRLHAAAVLDIEKLKSLSNIETLERRIVVKLIESVKVFEGSRIEITFCYQNEYERLKEAA